MNSDRLWKELQSLGVAAINRVKEHGESLQQAIARLIELNPDHLRNAIAAGAGRDTDAIDSEGVWGFLSRRFTEAASYRALESEVKGVPTKDVLAAIKAWAKEQGWEEEPWSEDAMTAIREKVADFIARGVCKTVEEALVHIKNTDTDAFRKAAKTTGQPVAVEGAQARITAAAHRIALERRLDFGAALDVARAENPELWRACLAERAGVEPDAIAGAAPKSGIERRIDKLEADQVALAASQKETRAILTGPNGGSGGAAARSFEDELCSRTAKIARERQLSFGDAIGVLRDEDPTLYRRAMAERQARSGSV